MPIACTRCGAKAEGEIITAPIAFTFKHNPGCAHGVGPLAVIRGKVPKLKTDESEFKKVEGKSGEKIVLDEAKENPVKEEIKVEETVKKSSSKKSKSKLFGKKD